MLTKSKDMLQKKILRAFWGVVFLGFGIFPGPAWGADLISYKQEAALFSLADLGPVDLSPKRVTVEVHVSPSPDLHPFHRLLPQVWPRVQNFYAQMGVLLEMVPGKPEPGPLESGKRLRLEALTHKEWLGRTYKAFKVEPPFRLRFLTVCQDKYAFAHLHLSTIHLDFKRFQESVCGEGSGEAAKDVEKFAGLIIHELGHLFGLYHAHEFVNDLIPEMLPDGKTANFMSHYLTHPGGLGFVDVQKRLMHSFLSGGKIYQQYRQVDFDPLRYLELLKLHNKYQEPPAKKSERLVRPAAFGDNEDEEDEEDDLRFLSQPRLTRCR